ncbi:MAG: 50S ribosomal protein L9 [Nocardioides sp.]|nr:50S ribosomal protein L9 [Nocardioides sp.]
MATKIILQQEVTGLGSAGDVVEVKDGYARNYLIPRGDAIRWTKGAESQIAHLKAARAARAVRDEAHAAEIKAKLEAATVNVKVRSGKDGRLYGAVTAADIAGAVTETTGESIDKRTIALGNPIKSLGAHEVSVKLHDEVSAKLALNVVPA